MTKYKTSLGKIVELTAERRRHILERHPDITSHFAKIKLVFAKPDQIRVDKEDTRVLLFYRWFAKIGTGKYLVAVCKLNERNFVLTFYLTNRIRTGKVYEQK